VEAGDQTPEAGVYIPGAAARNHGGDCQPAVSECRASPVAP
jgi:hypothetical protein